MKKIAVIAAKRSPIGKIPGELNSINETELISYIFKTIISSFKYINIEEAILGVSFPVEKDNLCRKAILHAGLSSRISATTVSKTCASSDEALSIACSKILSGKVKSVLVGGSEKISNSSYTLHFMKHNIKRAIKETIPYYSDIQNNIMENDMAYLYEMLSRKNKIDRSMQDEFTINSISKSLSAHNNNYFLKEIIPIQYIKDEQTYFLNSDEMLLYERSEENIHRAEPMFLKDGVITQFNAAAMCDCATAMIIMDYDEALKQGLKPKVFIADTVAAGVSKDRIGMAMTDCINKILKRNKLSKANIDLFEINEAFAAQALFTIKSLDLDLNKVNVNGGNLAIGYPIGTTGLRMCISLIHEMIRRQAKRGISAMCAGGNMANAVIFETVG